MRRDDVRIDQEESKFVLSIRRTSSDGRSGLWEPVTCHNSREEAEQYVSVLKHGFRSAK